MVWDKMDCGVPAAEFPEAAEMEDIPCGIMDLAHQESCRENRMYGQVPETPADVPQGVKAPRPPVERDVVNITLFQSGLLEAEPDRIGRPAFLVLFPCKTFFLGSRDNPSIADQRSRAVMGVTANSKYVHFDFFRFVILQM
jgi:hypothetical protein